MTDNRTVAALFDLDGVVIDTEGQYSKFWGEIGREYRPDLPHFETIIKGQTLTQIYDGYFQHLQNHLPEITRRLNAFEENMQYPYIPGVEAFLQQLRQHGVKTAVVTSSNDAKMQNVYQRCPHFKDYFDKVLTSEHFTHSKPHPYCYQLGARIFGLEPSDCVVFEDSFHGLEAGRAAQMKVVALATTNPAEAIRPLSDVVMPDFTDYTYEKMLALL